MNMFRSALEIHSPINTVLLESEAMMASAGDGGARVSGAPLFLPELSFINHDYRRHLPQSAAAGGAAVQQSAAGGRDLSRWHRKPLNDATGPLPPPKKA